MFSSLGHQQNEVERQCPPLGQLFGLGKGGPYLRPEPDIGYILHPSGLVP